MQRVACSAVWKVGMLVAQLAVLLDALRVGRKVAQKVEWTESLTVVPRGDLWVVAMVGPMARRRAGQKAVQLVAQMDAAKVAPMVALMAHLLVDQQADH